MSKNQGDVIYYFAIVGRKDNPLYESEFGQAKKEMRYLNQMIAHASLDMIDEQVTFHRTSTI